MASSPQGDGHVCCCSGCDAPMNGQEFAISNNGLYFCGSSSSGKGALRCRWMGTWDAASEKWSGEVALPARTATESGRSYVLVESDDDVEMMMETTSTSSTKKAPRDGTMLSFMRDNPNQEMDTTAPVPSSTQPGASALPAPAPDPASATDDGTATTAVEQPGKKRKTAAITSAEQAKAWLTKLVVEQKKKLAQIDSDAEPTFRNFTVVQQGEKVLLRCALCFEAYPKSKQALIAGQDMFSGSLRTHVLNRHFEVTQNGESRHDMGLKVLRQQQWMKSTVAAGHVKVREHVVTSLRMVAHLAQQENAIGQYSSLVALVRTCRGNVFPNRTFENDIGAWQLLEALAVATDRRFHAKLEVSEFLGLQVDESTDNADSNNIFMAIHWEENFMPCAGMLALKAMHTVNPTTNEVERATGGQIKKVISATIEATPGVSADKLMGFASDGASAMIGVRAGAATLLVKDSPYLTAIHCVAHRSNLGANAACASVALTKETDAVVTDVNSYLCKSPLRKAELKLLKEKITDERLPAIQGFFRIRFLSRGTAVAALVKNYGVLLPFLRAQGGQCVVVAANARLTKEEEALELRAHELKSLAETLVLRKARVEGFKARALSRIGPNLIGESQEELIIRAQLWDEAIEEFNAEIDPLLREEASLRQKIATTRLQHQAVLRGEPKGNETAAGIFERMSSFRMMGILFVLKDLLAILNELNTLFQFRLLTYKGILDDLERTKRKIRMQFLGNNGIQAYEYKNLLKQLGGGGPGGEAALRARLGREPGGFQVQYKDVEEKIRIKQADVDEVELAAKTLAENVSAELNKRYGKLELFDNFSIFDPQNFPTDDNALDNYGTAEIELLGEHYGKKHDGVPLCIDPEELQHEWLNARPVMFDVRRQLTIASKVNSLEADARASVDARNGEDLESHEDPALGRAMKKGERRRQGLSLTAIRLFADFWSAVKLSRGGAHFPNLYKLVKIYIVQPHSSIECERGFSAQNRIKSKSRNRLSVERLQLLMRLSLLKKQQGVDLAAQSSDDILTEAAVIFDEELGVVRRK